MGRYLEYFLEGHVPPAALTKLAQTHPTGIGIAAEPDVREHSTGNTAQDTQKPPMLIYDEKGLGRVWGTSGGA